MMQAGLKRYIQPFICYIKVDWWTPEVFTRCHLLHLPPCLFTSITAISERGGGELSRLQCSVQCNPG